MIDSFRAWSRGCLTMQGYTDLDDEDRKALWLGVRFSTALCFTGIAVGTVLASPVILLVMAATAALGGFVMAKHPFDHLYDLAVQPLLGGPKVPPTPAPRRFACQLATPWVIGIAVAFMVDAVTVAWLLALPLLVVAAVVTVTNWCPPSFIHGLLFGRHPAPAPEASLPSGHGQ